MDNQKLLREPCSYILRLCFCPKMASEAIPEHLISKNFQGEHAPTPPWSCMFMHAYIQIRHPCNPPSTNPGYGSAYIGRMWTCQIESESSPPRATDKGEEGSKNGSEAIQSIKFEKFSLGGMLPKDLPSCCVLTLTHAVTYSAGSSIPVVWSSQPAARARTCSWYSLVSWLRPAFCRLHSSFARVREEPGNEVGTPEIAAYVVGDVQAHGSFQRCREETAMSTGETRDCKLYQSLIAIS